jgi:glycosyltransferase involved in cell wall biosynthesis
VRESRTRVSIGVPVYNGERFLAETLESLLSQTFQDLEIVISDNASTDSTEQICRAYAVRDSRIRYYRNEINRGAAWNHNRVFGLSRGEFFKWNSADDLCAPDFVAVCVDALDHDPFAVVAVTEAAEIDECGNILEAVTVPNQTLFAVVPIGAPAHVRFRQNIRLDHLCLTIYSLIRSDVLRQTKLIGNYADSDRVLLSHLALLGHCAIVPQRLLLNRDHPGRFTRHYNGEKFRERTTWFDPSSADQRIFPYWRELSELAGVVGRAHLDWRERLRCYWQIGDWACHKDRMRLLYIDLTYYPRKWVVRRFPYAKVVWNKLWALANPELDRIEQG